MPATLNAEEVRVLVNVPLLEALALVKIRADPLIGTEAPDQFALADQSVLPTDPVHVFAACAGEANVADKATRATATDRLSREKSFNFNAWRVEGVRVCFIFSCVVGGFEINLNEAKGINVGRS